MAVKRQCCVRGCTDKTSPRHRLPRHNGPRLQEWIRRINNPFMQGKSIERIYSTYYICRRHFAPNCFSLGRVKLNENAYPTLYLPGWVQQNEAAYDTTYVLRIQDDPANWKEVAPQQSNNGKALEQILTKTENEIAVPNPDTDNTKTLDILSNEMDCVNNHHMKLDISDQSKNNEDTAINKRIMPSTPTTPQKRGIFRSLQVKSVHDLTPRKLHLYKTVTRLHKSERRIKKRCLLLKNKLKAIQHDPKNTYIKQLNLNPTLSRFICSQVETSNVKLRGRRFTVDDKIFALAIMKQSGKTYRLLSSTMLLPSRRCVQRLLQNFYFPVGINPHIMSHLKKTVEKFEDQDHYCVLMFDEVSLMPNIEWDNNEDLIKGFVDSGQDRSQQYADHAQVFMVRGLKKKWKMVLSYSFCKGTTPIRVLASQIKKTIQELRLAGLVVMATVCDQGSTNVAAINKLIQDSRAERLRKGAEPPRHGYLVDDFEILHIFDPPHLLKGIRNGLLDKELHFIINGKNMVAKWQHIEKLYDIDRESRFRACPALQDYHVVRNKIKKMKVSVAAKVFSHRVASTIEKLTFGESPVMEREAMDTAECCKFFDLLFDSMNGMALQPAIGKELRCAISETLLHLKFWHETALPVLQSMHFIDKYGKPSRPPSIKNWIVTMNSLIQLWKVLKDHNFQCLPTRLCNQDPVENLFGCIRMHGIRNTNPTCKGFVASIKTVIINNFCSPHSVGANCEIDEHDGPLGNLKSLITTHNPVQNTDNRDFNSIEITPFPGSTENFVDTIITGYIVGFLYRKIRNKFKDCNECRQMFTTKNLNKSHELIIAREYDNEQRLQYPSTIIYNIFKLVADYFFHSMATVCHIKGVGQYLRENISKLFDFDFLTCSHKDLVKQFFIKSSVKMLINYWCRTINSILSGKKQINISTTKDPMKILAQKYFEKMRKR